MIKYKIKEVKPYIFLVEFEDQYDMCMTFLRYQEYYESPNPKFRNKNFDLFDFMKWYSKEYGNGVFTYPKDWEGFNIPSWVIDRCYDTASTKYDDLMSLIQYKIEDKILKKLASGVYHDSNFRFYLIGALKGNNETIKHELAHGMFYLDKQYKKEMTQLVKQLKSSFRNKIYSHLKKIGYTKQVFVDECQAYLSTGVPESFGLKLNGEDKPFIEVFKKYEKIGRI